MNSKINFKNKKYKGELIADVVASSDNLIGINCPKN